MGYSLVRQVLQKQRGLTIRSTGRYTVCRHLGYKSLAQIPSICSAPVSSNVRPQNPLARLLAQQQENDVSRQIVFTTKAAKPPPTYSQAVKAAGLVFVSGTAPTDPATGAFKGTTIQEQTRQCLRNIQAILEEAGSSMDKIVSATIVMADEDEFAGMNEEWMKWFPSNPPARQGAKLPARIPGQIISIAAIAEA